MLIDYFRSPTDNALRWLEKKYGCAIKLENDRSKPFYTTVLCAKNGKVHSFEVSERSLEELMISIGNGLKDHYEKPLKPKPKILPKGHLKT